MLICRHMHCAFCALAVTASRPPAVLFRGSLRATAALAAVALGVWGYWITCPASTGWSGRIEVLDSLPPTQQLFLVAGELVAAGVVTWRLTLARQASVVVFPGAVIRAAFQLLQGGFRPFRARYGYRDHCIVRDVGDRGRALINKLLVGRKRGWNGDTIFGKAANERLDLNLFPLYKRGSNGAADRHVNVELLAFPENSSWPLSHAACFDGPPMRMDRLPHPGTAGEALPRGNRRAAAGLMHHGPGGGRSMEEAIERRDQLARIGHG